ncbi:MAG: hypothetical protein B7Z43_08990 [Sphingomonas sp. 12-62-6]|nr:MAG: hypothetical protein B7Z43_08990 [Sphingomonas sp. 12-62-6]
MVARGVEVTGEARRGAWSLSASYAFSDSRVSASGAALALDGLRPAQSPRHAASTTLGWGRERGVRLSTTLRYTGAQFEDDLESDVLPGVATLDATAHLPIGKRFAIVARAENLFDADVVTRNAGGSIDLGTPRLFWIGVRVR